MRTPVLNRRDWLAATAGTMALPSWAQAPAFPQHPLTIVVPAPTGGTADACARALSDPLAKALGQGVQIENKGGNNGATGAQALLAAPADGHTLLMAYSGFHCMTPHLVKLPYDPLTDLQPVCNVYLAPQVLVMRASLGSIKTVDDLIKYAKDNPGKLRYGSAGNGSVQNVATELFKQLTGTVIQHVPYRGTGPIIADLLEDKLDMTLTTAPALLPHIASGKLRALLVAGRKRLASLPQVPTGTQVGIRHFEVEAWFGLYTHAKVPKPAVERVSAEVQKIMATAAFRDRAATQGAEASYLDPMQMGAYAYMEYTRWGKVIKQSNITAD